MLNLCKNINMKEIYLLNYIIYNKVDDEGLCIILIWKLMIYRLKNFKNKYGDL